jgi:RNA polymerase sigma-70 factor (ECF subfamily)
MNKDSILSELGALARREGEAESPLDERWDRLAAGTLTAEEDAELRALAASSDEAREAYEAFRPLGAAFQARVVSAINAKRTTEEAVDLIRRALTRDPAALNKLVAILTPVIQARVARKLRALQYLSAGGRNVRQEVEDLCQDVFVALFERDAHVLRAWRPERGLSLENFVGLVAERKVLTFRRNGWSNLWREELTPAEGELESEAPEPGPEKIVANRELLSLLLGRLREELSPLGYWLFELIFVQELSQEEVQGVSGLSDDAIYAWRSRLRRRALKLRAEISGNATPPRKI